MKATKKAPKVAAPMASGVTPEQEEELRDFVRRIAKTYDIDADKAWREHCQKVIKQGWEWFVRVRDEQLWLAADYLASRQPGLNSTPGIQWPHVETAPAPPSVFVSWEDYLARTTAPERMKKCRAAAKKANRKRLLSSAPKFHLTGEDVWTVYETAKGHCAHCGSLAVERRPSTPKGAPLPWAQIGRRIGSLEHSEWRIRGGDNDLSNLAWSCLWCNTWPSERRRGALDHGGFYPSIADNVHLPPSATRDSVEKFSKQRRLAPMASKPATKAKPAAAPKTAAAKKSATPAMTAAKKPGAKAAQRVSPKAAPVAAPKKAETVTLKTLFEQLGEAHALPKKQAHALAAGMVDSVTSILKNGDRVRLTGLGIIEVKDRPARMGRNPGTGEAVQIAASRKVAFRVAKELKLAV